MLLIKKLWQIFAVELGFVGFFQRLKQDRKLTELDSYLGKATEDGLESKV